MGQAFLTSLNEEEFKLLLKQIIKEVLEERGGTDTTSEILDAEQAADFLNMALPTLYEKTCRKLIPHFKQGKKLYFKRSELQEWIQAGKVKTQKEIEQEAENYVFRRKNFKSL